MLEDIRQGAKGPMGKVLVVVISLAFGLWGVSTVVPLVFGGGAPVTVNGERITEPEIAQRVFQERQAIIEQFGGQIDPSLIRDELIRPQVINQMIVQRLVSQAAADHGFVLSDDGLNRILVRQSAFQTEGRFNSDVFASIAARQGMNASQFRDQIGANEVAQQWINGLLASEFVLPNESALYSSYLHQTRTIDYKVFEPEDFRDQVQIETADIEAFYDREAQRFQTPERISVNYVRLKPENLLGDWAPSVEDLESAYDRYVEQISDERDSFISHILITLDQRSDDEALALAESLRERAQQEDFAQLAEVYSEDPGSASQGGTLGRFDANVFLPEFAAVVSQLDRPGDLSDVFSTAFGYHIVQLDTVTSPPVLSFSDMQEQLTEQLTRRYLSTRLPIIREELEALAFSSLDLGPIADTFDVSVEQSPLFDRSGSGWTDATREIVDAALSPEVLDDGLNSTTLVLEDGSLMVLRRHRFEPAATRPLAEVEAEIRDQLVNQALNEAAERSAQTQFASLEQTPLIVADWQDLTDLSRFDEALPEEVVEAIFRVPAPSSESEPTPFIANMSEGRWVVGRVNEVVSGTSIVDEEALILSFLRDEFSTDSLDGLITHLQSIATIRIR
jgi:peptidyl-prolyl cis-trans isomerase D